jgi:hypothetical protein
MEGFPAAAVIIPGLSWGAQWGAEPRQEVWMQRRGRKAAAALHEGSNMRVRRLSACMHEGVFSRRLLAHNRADLRTLGKSIVYSCCLVAPGTTESRRFINVH